MKVAGFFISLLQASSSISPYNHRLVTGLRSSLYFLLIIIFLSCGKKHMLESVVVIPYYPSASGIEYFRNHYYVIGDDANRLLILDSNLSVIDSVILYETNEKRMPKDTKADLESISTIGRQEQLRLFIAGSGSVTPYRNKGWLINPLNKEKTFLSLDTFYQRLHTNGLADINIEGACGIPGSIIFSNRGHKAYRKNFLVITPDKFWHNQLTAPIKLIQVGSNADTSLFNGVSGMDYAMKSDRLILTVSTEDTKNSFDDGAIGKSYLWIIENISSKRNWISVNPNQVIDLDQLDSRFKKQKIESVCVVKETRHFLHLVLAADNDDGSSTLFQVSIEKN